MALKKGLIKMTQQPMMDQRIKKTILDALMNVVDSAPTKARNYYAHYNSHSSIANPYEVTSEQFNIWINYINSTLQIISQYIGMGLYITIRNDISTLANQSSANYTQRTFDICDRLLKFAQTIIYL